MSNQNRSGDSNIRVAVRVRPLLADEVYKSTARLNAQSGSKIVVYNERTAQHKQYHFDHVFSNVKQSQVFEEANVESLIDRVVQGFNATVFVYGQTGSGKTYTMEGY